MTRRRAFRDLLVVCLAGLAALLVAPAATADEASPDPSLDPDLLAGLAARSIGPATMSGRVAAIEALTSDPRTVYVGAATGGVWKSTDGALTWTPIFDDQPVAAIGSIAVFQPAPDLVWVGTGEGNPRNSASVGNGVYKSLDGGKTWAHVGLADSERIHRIVLHPSDPDTAWVAALGPTWGHATRADGGERGVFKTTDGGATWRNVLAVSATTGASDLVLDPANPRRLLAALWDHKRWPWFFRSGGPGSGIFESVDGGESWTRLGPEEGLPEGDLGRIGLAIAPSDPRIAYAFVEAEGETNRLLRSEDGGSTWSEVATTATQEIGNRPFYYADLRVDPADPNRVYSLWSLVSLSTDGGRTWSILVPFAEAHPDHHALWIDPADPRHLYLGNDGGVYVSRDRGGSWRFVRNLPLAQLYHVRVDDADPFNVYFGLQDNGSWVGPSTAWRGGGVRSGDWQEVFFGDGFDTVPDPENPGHGYAMAQEGFLAYWHAASGTFRMIRPEAPPGEPPLRYNWNAGIALDPFEPSTVYFGSQHVHRSRDRGATWERISDDLTTDRAAWQQQARTGGLTPDVTGAENFTSIVAIAPSPVERGVLWVGTDDGRLHVSRDAGGTWASVETGLVAAGMPEHSWIPHVEPSRHAAGEAFVVADDHRRGDWTPYAFRTRDFGATWTRLVRSAGDRAPAKDSDPSVRGYALSIVQDPVDRDLLFLGTEFGLWTSVDGGGSWHSFRHGVPTVSVMDLAIQERESSLVLGTHGRGVYILDDIAPLRGLDAETLEAPLHLFEVPTARLIAAGRPPGSRFAGADEFLGASRPEGARIYVSLRDESLPRPDPEDEAKRQRDERALAREARLRETERETLLEPADETVDPASTDAAEDPAADEPTDDEPTDDEPMLEIEIEDADGTVIRTLEQPARRGVQRVVWDLARAAGERPPGVDEDEWPEAGAEVAPGTYPFTVTVELPSGTESARGTIEVVAANAPLGLDDDARRARADVLERVEAMRDLVVDALRRLESTRADLDRVDARLAERLEERDEAEARGGSKASEPATLDAEASEDQSPLEVLQADVETLREALDDVESALWTSPDAKGIPYDQTPWSQLGLAGYMLGSHAGPPEPTTLRYLERAEAALAAVLPRLERLETTEIEAVRRGLRALDVGLLPPADPLTIPTPQRPEEP